MRKIAEMCRTQVVLEAETRFYGAGSKFIVFSIGRNLGMAMLPSVLASAASPHVQVLPNR